MTFMNAWGRMRQRVRRHARWMGVILVAFLGLVLLLLQCPARPRDLPARLGQLALTEIIRGSEAQTVLNQMHTKGIAPQLNLIGTYRSREGSATVYMSFFDDPRIAILQMERMADLIQHHPTPFDGFRRIERQGVEIIACTNMGRPQYCFAGRGGVYWISADASVDSAALEALVAEMGH